MSDAGRFVWYDLLTSEPEAARDFYREVVGWGLEPFEGGATPYFMWTADGTPMGGVGELPAELAAEGVPPHWMAHAGVDDLDEAVASVRKLGGSVRKPPSEIPEVGRFAVVVDPQGATLSLFQAGGDPVPPRDRRKAGFVGWNELNTTDHRGAWTFYSSLFGWKRTTEFDMGEMGPYAMFRHPADPGEEAMGGMSDIARHMGLPPHWLHYVNVDDLDGAVERIESGGGAILNGPMEVPGGGRIVQAKDPQGGAFALFEPV